MEFKVGDVVKGNEYHINRNRMEDLGVITKADPENGDYWVTWKSDNRNHYAHSYELNLASPPA